MPLRLLEEIDAVTFGPHHIPEVNRWRSAHGQPTIHPSNFPTHGAVGVYHGMYHSFLGAYIAPSQSGKIAFIQWAVNAPDIGILLARELQKAALEHLSDVLKNEGVHIAIANVHDALVKPAKRIGYTVMEDGQKTVPMAVLFSK